MFSDWLCNPVAKTASLSPLKPGSAIIIPMVKAEARRRVLSVIPDWKQANMTARAVELVRIKAEGRSWTAGEQTEADALDAAWEWIKSVRAASDLIEADGNNLTIAQVKSDNRWPANP